MPVEKINTLNAERLKLELRLRNASAKGNKAELVQRLCDYVGADEIDTDGFKTPESSIENDVSELRDEVKRLTELMASVLSAMPSAGNVGNVQVQEPTVPKLLGNDMKKSVMSPSAISEAVVCDRTDLVTRTSGESHVHSIRDITDILPDFDPSSECCMSSTQFVDRVTKLAEAYQWNDKILVFAVQSCLKGPAKIWSDEAAHIPESWSELAESLKRDFPCHDCEADIHIKLISRTREPSETTQNYFYTMVALGRRGSVSESAIIRYIRNGLRHPLLQNAIASTNFATVNDLLSAITSFERNSVNVPEPRTESRRNFGPPQPIQRSIVSPNVRAQTTSNSSEPRRVRCYNCLEVGHISLNCPKPQRKQRCEKCQRTTHTTNQCTETKATTDKATTTFSNIRRISSTERINPLVKEVLLNGTKINSFVDPGSERTLIRRTTAMAMDGIRQCSSITLRGFGGASVTCNQILEAEIQFDGKILKAKIVPVDDDLIPEPLLLGSDLLCTTDKRLIIESGECRLESALRNASQIGPTLTAEEENDLHNLISEHKDCFSESLASLGQCNTVTMTIKLTTSKPVQRQPYRIPFAKRERVQEKISELLENDIIRPSSSEYSSPIVLIRKQNGEDRLCVDFREINAITEKRPFLMPTVEEQLSSIAGNVYYSTLDLMSGYYQIPIAEDCRRYTAFVTHSGQYEFNRMPFGLCNAPSYFHEVITKLVRQMGNRAVSYVDEVIIPSKTISEGMSKLREFLVIVRDAGMTLRPSKCTFLSKEITFLGHRVDEDGIKPGFEKTKAIREFPEPTSVTEVRRFLGLSGFFRKFIRDYSLISKPLTILLKQKNNPEFCWSIEQRDAFEQLKSALCCEPVLAIYDPTREHQVHTDASTLGLAGILMQRDDGGNFRPVFYYSRQCSESESRYHSHELEVLAIVESLERFRIYLLGKHFDIVTDCAAISTTRSSKPLLPHIGRWFLKLQEYDFHIIHRSAERMSHADALSRAPNEPPIEPEIASGNIMRVEENNDWLVLLQRQDVKLKELSEVLRDEVESTQSKQIKNDYCLKNGRLYRKVDQELKFVVPSAVRWKIIRTYHDDMGHFGIEKTINRVRQHFWFANLRKYIKSYIAACLECCYNKGIAGKPEGQLYSDEVTPIPFRTLHVDHLGPFPRSRRGNLHIVGISDSFSKYIILRAVKTTKSKPVIETFKDLTMYFGLPNRIISDRGTAFTSREFAEFCASNEIQHIKVAVRTPRSNGQIERANQSILSFLRTAPTDHKDWDLQLRNLQWSLNSQRHSVTKFSPIELIFDYHLRDVITNRLLMALTSDDAIVDQAECDMVSRRQTAAERIETEREKWRLRFNAKHKTPFIYKEGDLIVLENVPAATGESRKLEPKYRGPFIITRVLRNDRYLVEDVGIARPNQRKFCSVYTSEKMKPWIVVSPELDSYDDTSESETE